MFKLLLITISIMLVQPDITYAKLTRVYKGHLAIVPLTNQWTLLWSVTVFYVFSCPSICHCVFALAMCIVKKKRDPQRFVTRLVILAFFSSLLCFPCLFWFSFTILSLPFQPSTKLQTDKVSTQAYSGSFSSYGARYSPKELVETKPKLNRAWILGLDWTPNKH